jgi:predicted PurR-regulated permease PerM
MESAQVQARTVAKVVVTALAVVAAALLLVVVLLHTSTTLHWLVTAAFLALALSPPVGFVENRSIRGWHPPRWLATLVVYLAFFAFFAFVVLEVIPPIVSEVKGLATKLPGYIHDFKVWAADNQAFQDLNAKYNITQTLNQEAQTLPSHLGDAAGAAGSLTVSAAKNLIAAITVLALAFFLILDRGKMYLRIADALPENAAGRWRRVGEGVYRVVKSYVSVTLLLAVIAGLFTWGMLELLGVPLAIPLAVILAFFDLIPLIGLTVGGILIAIAVGLTWFPGGLIIWLVAFLVFQQVQDRVIQPLLFKNAVSLNPAVSIIAVLAGAELAGILGALIAIPVAGSIGVVITELARDAASPEPAPVAPDQG